MTRRRWLAGVALACGALLTATGCGGGGSTDSKGPVTLTYALWDPHEQIGYQKSIDEFEKLHPDIHVRIQQLDFNDYWTKLDAEFSAGNGPDVFTDHVSYFPQYAQQGILLNLTPYLQQDHVDTSAYYPSLLKAYQYNGGQYGLPKDWDTIATVCNKDALSKAGVTNPGRLTWTPSGGGTLLPFLQKLTVDKSGKNAAQAGFNSGNVQQYGMLAFDSLQEGWGNWMAGNGATMMDKPFGKFTFDSPQAVQGMQAYVDLVNKDHVAPSGAETHNASVVQFLASGRVACATAGDWELSPLTQQSHSQYVVLPIPAGPQGEVSAFNGLSDGIYAQTKHPKQAWELVKWLASPQSQQILGSGGYVWPAIKSLDSGFLNYWKGKGIDVQPYLDEANGKTFSFPISPAWNAAGQQITNVFDQVFTGQLPVPAGVQQAAQQANQAASQQSG